MREIRPSGSEGGARLNPSLLPLSLGLRRQPRRVYPRFQLLL
jgi:hypothetical protein